MGATDPAQGAGASNPAQAEAKGKGKAVPEDVSMGEEDTSSDEETGAEDDVCCVNPPPHPVLPPNLSNPKCSATPPTKEMVANHASTIPRLQKCVCYDSLLFCCPPLFFPTQSIHIRSQLHVKNER